MQLEAVDRPEGRVLVLRGRWTVEQAAALEPLVVQAGTLTGRVILDAAAVEAMDLTGAWLLRSLEQRLAAAGAQMSWARDRPGQLDFVEEVAAQAGWQPAAEAGASPRGLSWLLNETGRLAVHGRGQALDVIGFIGAVWTVFGRALLNPRRLRLPSVARHVYETGLAAVPIVALIAFLISVIVAYIGAQQLLKFGGEIFVVDLVTVSVLRELGVLLTAIIVAGRSGSAFAAELGVMQLNDEVDALRAIGMDPVEVLIVPRVLGLMIALPALTVVADAIGLAGGALLSWYLVDIPLGEVVERMQGAIADTTFWVGIIKAPVFAFLIATIGTLRGMQVRSSSRELGRLTTVAVVQSIFMVILADAIFAVIFIELDV